MLGLSQNETVAAKHTVVTNDGSCIQMNFICIIDNRVLQQRLTQYDYHLHGERMRIERTIPSTAMQVIVSTESSVPIHEDVLEGYFGNPRVTGVSAHGRIDVRAYDQKDDVFIITYSSENGKMGASIWSGNSL